MQSICPCEQQTGAISDAARSRMLTTRGEPFLFSDWKRVVFLHFETDPEILQREVPFPLDLHQGRAYVSIVAFYLERMRPRLGGPVSALLMKPVATHELCNIRAYVRRNGEPGIYFLAEYLPNLISATLGPPMYGLPYRMGRLHYAHHHEQQIIEGKVTAKGLSLAYKADIPQYASFGPCEANTRDEFLLERYTAFTKRGETERFFRIWHPPWPQIEIEAAVIDTSLLPLTGEWIRHARFIGAHYSPGVDGVWMGYPRQV